MGDTSAEPVHLRIVYERAEEGWTTAMVPAVPGTIRTGRNRREARDNVLDALRLMLSTPPERPEAPGQRSEEVEITLGLVRSHDRGHER
jgi:predicted RNase H-like HicB family nuclease